MENPRNKTKAAGRIGSELTEIKDPVIKLVLFSSLMLNVWDALTNAACEFCPQQSDTGSVWSPAWIQFAAEQNGVLVVLFERLSFFI